MTSERSIAQTIVDMQLTGKGKMNEISKQAIDLTAVATDDLYSQLAECMRVTAESLVKTAAIVMELEARGEDLSRLRIGMMRYLKRIAAGELSADVVVKFSGFPLLLNHVSQLPSGQQKLLASGEKIAIASRSPSGEYSSRMVDPLDMTAEMVYQVFDQGRIRSWEQQIPRLESQLQKQRKRTAAKQGKIWYDAEQSTLRVGRYSIPVDEVLEALGNAQGNLPLPESDMSEEPHKPVMLPSEYHRQLKLRSAQTGNSIAELVRSALRATGLYAQPEEE